jgi:hypothetical protein
VDQVKNPGSAPVNHPALAPLIDAQSKSARLADYGCLHDVHLPAHRRGPTLARQDLITHIGLESCSFAISDRISRQMTAEGQSRQQKDGRELERYLE